MMISIYTWLFVVMLVCSIGFLLVILAIIIGLSTEVIGQYYDYRKWKNKEKEK